MKTENLIMAIKALCDLSFLSSRGPKMTACLVTMSRFLVSLSSHCLLNIYCLAGTTTTSHIAGELTDSIRTDL